MDVKPVHRAAYQKPSDRKGSQSANRGKLEPLDCAKFGRRVELQLLHGNFLAARAVIDEAESLLLRTENVTSDTPLASTELGESHLRLLNGLERSGIRTVGDLLRFRIDELNGMYDISVHSIGIVISLTARWKAEIETREEAEDVA